jgi:hypothetical protein
MAAAAMSELRTRAAAGDVGAMTRLGTELLTAPEASAEEGLTLITAAADAGGAEAAHLLAVFAGAGYLRPQSWSEALDLVQLAAERGLKLAQDELALLAHANSAARDKSVVWARLRSSVEVEDWIRPRGRRAELSTDPRIGTIDGFASPEQCAWLIERARPRLKRARVYGKVDAKGREKSERTNREAAFNLVEFDLVLLMLRARIGAATSLPPQAMEPVTVLNYAPGQEFLRHFDFLDPSADGLAQEIARNGQRIATFLLYLNDDFEGGETDFPLLGLRHRGRAGDALFFANVGKDRQPHRKTLHAGLPPTKGEKWLLSQWVRDRMPKTFVRRG